VWYGGDEAFIFVFQAFHLKMRDAEASELGTVASRYNVVYLKQAKPRTSKLVETLEDWEELY
jgi:hypothetical protein